MKFWQWVLFELITILVSVAGFVGCAIGCQAIFTTMPLGNPVCSFVRGIGGFFLGALGVGFLFAIGFIVVMIFEVNPEVYEEELQNRK